MEQEFESSVKNLIELETLKWIFVGGKGGVGKTTTSSSLATLFSQHRGKVLIISTDPAHNLGDSFQQSLSAEPTLINGFENLYGMEVESKIDANEIDIPTFLDNAEEGDEGKKAFWAELISSMPGIDEIMVFTRVIKKVEELGFDVVIFDTAPTGHTLKLLHFPKTMEKGLEKFMTMKDKLQGVVQGFMAGTEFEQTFESTFKKLKDLKDISSNFQQILTDDKQCTFVAVCIPEYLSIYETERLVQDLTVSNIDIQNIVVNQIVIPESGCNKCQSRYKMQKKYIDQIFDLYFDFHVTLSPLRDNEVKGIEGLKDYASGLIDGLKPSQLPEVKP